MAVASGWDLPPIETIGELADWFGVSCGHLDWYADLGDFARRPGGGKLRHYRYTIVTKRSGGVRLIEAPKQQLKRMQRRILERILDRIPAHPAAHGFVPGRSTRSFAAPHAGRSVVLRMDLRDFFPSVSGSRVAALFRVAGYPEAVAGLLGGVCTTATPNDVWQQAVGASGTALAEARALHRVPHLPQGSPTSPALANARAWRLDCRLTGLARAAGAVYTRYADDLGFSGGEEFGRRVKRFAASVAVIAMEEGSAVNFRKRGSRAAGCARSWQGSWSTIISTSRARSTTGSRRRSPIGCVMGRRDRTDRADFRARIWMGGWATWSV
jgi:hypothetical protein